MENDSFIDPLLQQASEYLSRSNQPDEGKIKSLLKELQKDKIPRKNIEAKCFQGIPNTINGLRSLCWKILLKYLPEDKSKWKETLEIRRKDYETYVTDYFRPIAKETRVRRKSSLNSASSEIIIDGNPKMRSRGTSNAERVEKNIVEELFSKDLFLWELIDKDTRRTQTKLDFCQKETEFPLKSEEEEHAENHSYVLSRILFIYAKLNPGDQYVQGMNEILAPIYYVFSKDPNPMFKGHAEADSFYCFTNLMDELRDTFVSNQDNKEKGIFSRIKEFSDLFKKIDKPLWSHLDKYQISPQYYSLKWLMLLLAQEFPMNDLLVVWDELVSHPRRLSYINFLCVAMVYNIRDSIISDSDFSSLMEKLQNKTNKDVDKIRATAFTFYKQYERPELTAFHIVFPPQ